MTLLDDDLADLRPDQPLEPMLHTEIPPADLKVIATNLGTAACRILGLPRQRLRSVRLEPFLPMPTKSVVVFDWDPDLSPEQADLLDHSLSVLFVAMGGSPVFRVPDVTR